MDITNYGLWQKYDRLKRFADKFSDTRYLIEWFSGSRTIIKLGIHEVYTIKKRLKRVFSGDKSK